MKDAKTKHGTQDIYPTIQAETVYVIQNNLFRSTEDIIQVLKPIGDCIGHLEKAKTNLADIYLQMIELHSHYRKLESEVPEHPLVKAAIGSLSKRFKQYFSEDIFVIALFFWPRYRDFVSSRFYELLTIKTQILKLMQKWSYVHSNAKDVMVDVGRYCDSSFSEQQLNQNPTTFWQTASSFQRPLRSLVNTIYKLKGHAAPVESLFSRLSYTKPKIRNKMSTEHMKMMSIIEDGLKKDVKIKKNRKRRAATIGCVAVNDSLTEADANADEDEELETAATMEVSTLDIEDTGRPDFEQMFEAMQIEDDDESEENDMEAVEENQVQETQVNITVSYIDTLYDLTKLPLRNVNATIPAAAAAVETAAAEDCTLLTADMFDELLL